MANQLNISTQHFSDRNIFKIIIQNGRITSQEFLKAIRREYYGQIKGRLRHGEQNDIHISLSHISGMTVIPDLDKRSGIPSSLDQNFYDSVKSIEINSCTRLKKIDKLIMFPNLETLTIARTPYIQLFPIELCNLKNLKHFWINNPRMESFRLPLEFNNITSLEELGINNIQHAYLSFNFADVEEGVSGLINLKKLQLCNTKIIGMPDNLHNLKNIEEIDLSGSEFLTGNEGGDRVFVSYRRNGDEEATFLNSIKNLPNLEILKLSKIINGENFETLFRIEDGDLPSLKILNLSSNNLKEIHSSIYKLTTLTELNLKNNKIEEIHSDISNLTDLKNLNISENKIAELPDSMGQLVSLEKLYLEYNMLEELPSTFVNLTNVNECLFKAGNPILSELFETRVEESGGEMPVAYVDIFKLFDKASCSQRPYVVRSINSQYNTGIFTRDYIVNFTGSDPARLRARGGMAIPLFSEDNEPDEGVVNVLISMGFSENAAKKATIINFNDVDMAINWLTEKSRPDVDEPLGHFNYLQQTLILMEDLFKGKNYAVEGRVFPLKGLYALGFFRVRYLDNPGIDAGGLYRQYITDMSKYFESDNDMVFKKESSGKIVVNRDTKNLPEMLSDILLFLTMIYNSGYGSFTSIFKFGHAITLYQGVFPDKNIFESKSKAGGNLENVVKDFAIKILDEPEERVNILNNTHIRLLTYLWLMAEYIDNDMGLLEGMNCTAVKTHNVGGESPMYEYIFMGAEFPPAERANEVGIANEVGNVANIMRNNFNQNRTNEELDEMIREILPRESQNRLDQLRNIRISRDGNNRANNIANNNQIVNNDLPMPPGAIMPNNNQPLPTFEELQARFLEIRSRLEEEGGTPELRTELDGLRNDLAIAQGGNEAENNRVGNNRVGNNQAENNIVGNNRSEIDLEELRQRLDDAEMDGDLELERQQLQNEFQYTLYPEELRNRVDNLIRRAAPSLPHISPARNRSISPVRRSQSPVRRNSPVRNASPITLPGEDEIPSFVQTFDRLRGPTWRSQPDAIRSFERSLAQSRRDAQRTEQRRSVARDRNNQSIQDLPYVENYMRERHGPNWRNNPGAVTAFRGLVTRERRQDNEATATGNPAALATIEARFGRDWRESMEARRELRRLDRRTGRRGGGRVQRGGAYVPIYHNHNYNIAPANAPLPNSNSNSNSSNDLLYYKTLASTYEVEDIIIEKFKKWVQFDKDVISIFINREDNCNPRDIDNVFLFNAIFNPRSSINIPILLSKIQFGRDITETTKDLVKSMITDAKEGMSEEDIREIDGEISRLLPEDSTNNSFDSLYPNQELFVKKFLEYSTGSRTLNDPIKIFYRDRENFEAHTCFNELVMNNFETKKDLIKTFIRSLLLGGETFGVGKLRRRTMKKSRRNNRLSEKKFKKYLSKRMKKTQGSNKKKVGKSRRIKSSSIDINNLLHKLRKTKPKGSKLKIEKKYLLDELEYERNNPVDPEFINHKVRKFLKRL